MSILVELQYEEAFIGVHEKWPEERISVALSAIRQHTVRIGGEGLYEDREAWSDTFPHWASLRRALEDEREKRRQTAIVEETETSKAAYELLIQNGIIPHDDLTPLYVAPE